MKTALGSIFLFMALGLFAPLTHALNAPPADPILRMETGMHTAVINRIGVDRAEKTLVTASDDKTVRVWDIATGKLKQILRVPLDQGKDGKLYSIAISPDGRTVAAGGFTGWNWEQKNSIYLFDLTTGTMKNRITDLPNVILHLSFSPNGQYLAATLGKENGVRVYHTTGWTEAGRDADYGNQSNWVDFDPAGRLVTTCWDGYIRLYDNRFRLIIKKKVPGGKKPFCAVFSPKGDEIAVGFYDTTKVNILSASTLALVHAPDTNRVNNGYLSSVAWSTDGTRLYAGGGYHDGTGCPVINWTRSGRGDAKNLPGSQNGITHLLSLKNGNLLFGAGDPAWGLLDARESLERFVAPAIADYRAVYDNFLLSADGATVQFGFELWGKRPAIFSVAQQTLSTVTTTATTATAQGLKPPVTSTNNLTISGWKNTDEPKVSGQALELESYEKSFSLAIAPDRDSFLLGTNWYLRRFDTKGKQIWEMPAPEVVWGVNISADGRLTLAAMGDGTIRWYRMTDGKLILSLFPHNDGKRWVLWTPQGYYAASSGGDALIGWHVNHGPDKTPDFFSANKFRSVYYRPDVLEKILVTLDTDKALKMANEESGRKNQEIALEKMYPPVVTILSPGDNSRFSTSEVTLRYTVRTPSGEPVTRIKVVVDGRPLPMARTIRRKKGGEMDIILPERDCRVALIAENRYAASEPAEVQLLWHKKTNPAFDIKPKLYVLAIGTSAYDNKAFTLGYPAKDARDVAAVFTKQKNGLYRDVVTRVLTDPTKDDVLDGLEWIERETTARDVAALFMAGHGVNDRNGNYYYLPANADPDRLKRTGVSYASIKDTVTGLPGKVLFFIDTCHSGNIMGNKRRGTAADVNQIANDLAAAENGIIVFTSSTGKQFSLENDQWKNGAFTKALVEALSGKADYHKDRKITVNELELYVAERVKELTHGQQTPTTTKPETIPDFTVVMKQ